MKQKIEKAQNKNLTRPVFYWLRVRPVTNILHYLGKEESSFTLDGGQTHLAAKKALKAGLCLEEDFPSEDYLYGTASEILDNIQKIRQTANTRPPSSCLFDYDIVRTMFPNVSLDNLVDIIEQSTKATFVTLLRNRSCLERIRPQDIEVVSERPSTSFEDKMNFLKVIDGQLDENAVSVISYNVEVLYYSVREIEYLNKPQWHSSLVVGRKFNEEEGKCLYLIRNSHGRSCSQYFRACEEGNIWVPKEDLAKVLEDVTYVR